MVEDEVLLREGINESRLCYRVRLPAVTSCVSLAYLIFTRIQVRELFAIVDGSL